MMIPPWEKKKTTLIKVDAESSPDYGCPPEKRSIENHIRLGVINVDKPSGPSSHEVVSWVKRILKLKRVGHGGTLETGTVGEIQK